MTRLNITGQDASQLRFAQFSLSRCSSWFVTFVITFNKVIRRYGNVLPVLRIGLGISGFSIFENERGTSCIVSKVTQSELILSMGFVLSRRGTQCQSETETACIYTSLSLFVTAWTYRWPSNLKWTISSGICISIQGSIITPIAFYCLARERHLGYFTQA